MKKEFIGEKMLYPDGFPADNLLLNAFWLTSAFRLTGGEWREGE